MVLLKKASHIVIDSLERFFLWWGKFVAIHPYPVICTCIIITALSSLGFLRFRMEHHANLLWIPADSSYNVNEDWLEQFFKKDERDQIVLFQSENVLTPKALNEMFDIYKRIQAIKVDGKTFDNICATVPIADIFQTKKRRKRQTAIENDDVTDNATDDYEEYDFWADEYNEYPDEDEIVAKEKIVRRINFQKYGNTSTNKEAVFDTVDNLPDNIYCDLVTTLNEKCILTNLLEIWRYDEEHIRTTTPQEIIDAVNLLTKSPWFGYDVDYTKFLGGIERNTTGHIISARTAQMIWKLKLPEDIELVDNQGSGLELELADKTTLEWEEEFVQIVQNMSKPDAIALPHAAKSFGDISSDAIFFDAYLMAGGYLVMFAYTIFMLGKLNTLEVRLFLSVSGLVSIFMGLGISLSLSSLLGYPYTPMHAALPFLCLGIGIDDMFVIVQCWTNMKRDTTNLGLSIPDKMAIALKHAGVSVTVTSLTDVFAFGVGAVTKMPGLESFCVCTAIGLGSIYLLQVSWFVAWMTLDEQRVEAGRDGLLPCIVHQDFQPSDCSKFEVGLTVMKYYAKLLSSSVFKVITILITVSLLAFGAWGWCQIKQKFDPILLLPSESYLREWIRVQQDFYPDDGWVADVYSGEISYKDLESIDTLVSELEYLQKDGRTLKGVDSWWTKLKEYADDKTDFTSWQQFSNENDFQMLLSDFLFSSYGSKYKPNFKFGNEKLICNEKAPPIKATKFQISYFAFEGPETHIPARSAVTQVIDSANSPYTFSHCKVYAAWETDEIIGYELWRNIGLAMICVFIVTLLLLCNLQICIMVILIVVFTLTDIVGFLHFWDITIDIISCVNIVLAIGLCVDYSVHIGHAFLIAKGTRHEKALESISTIGPAVFNGGLTTFLALVLCSFSSSHVFITFFKVFALTVIFGLFHGLVLFPVVLSLIGPTYTLEPDSLADSTLTISTTTHSQKISPSSSGSNTPNLGFMHSEKKPHILEQPWIQKDAER
jgi:predicted RND superfamily exporter protein